MATSLSAYTAAAQSSIKLFGALFKSAVTSDLITLAASATTTTAGQIALADVLFGVYGALPSGVLVSTPTFTGYRTTSTTAEFAATLIDTMTAGTSVTTATKDSWKAVVVAALPSFASRGALAVTLMNLFDTYTGTDAEAAAVNNVMDNRSEAAASFAQTAAGATFTSVTALVSTVSTVTNLASSVTTVVVAGTNFSLTTGIDTITGTAGNDTIAAIGGTGATVSVADSVNGGDGTDIFKLFTDGAVVLPALTSIESLFINDTVHQSTTIASTVMVAAGVTDLYLQAGTTIAAAGVTVTLAAANTLTLDGITDGDGTADGATQGEINLTAASTVTSMAVTVKDVGGTGTLLDLDLDVTATGVTTVNLVSTGTNSISLANTGAAISTLNVSGAGAVVAWGALPTTVKTVNAATATGAVTVDVSGAVVATATGGAGADTFILGANFVGAENTTVASRDTINGGAGRDTLSITSAIAASTAATSVAQTTVTNVEIITISDASAANVDLTKFTGADTLKFGSTVGAFTYTVNTGSTVEYVTGAAGNNARSYVVTGTGTTDAITLKGVAATDLGNAAQTFTGVETLTVTTGTTAGTAMIFGGTLVMSPTAGVAGGAIIATGVNPLTLTGVVTAASLDASALTGILTVTAAPANSITIKGGTKADVITGSTANDSITGGEGADTITAGAGSDVVILTETTAAIDKVVFSGVAVANDGTAGTQVTANGVDVITGFAAGDLINVAALGGGTTPSGLAAITAPAAQAALTTDRAIVISATGLAASLTLLGTAVITDFTNMTQVGAYLTERFTVTADAQLNVIVFNNTSGSNDTSYVYTISNVGTDTTIDVADIFLVGTITHTAGTALTAANVVYA